MVLKLKRVYDPREDGDGRRILVDRLWPRGMSKSEAGVDLWLKEVAPSPGLRRWFGHDPKKWDEFRRRYRKELEENTAALDELKNEIGRSAATLLYGAKDTEHNHALVLKELIESS
jgi:Uncharacterized conserved protein